MDVEVKDPVRQPHRSNSIVGTMVVLAGLSVLEFAGRSLLGDLDPPARNPTGPLADSTHQVFSPPKSEQSFSLPNYERVRIVESFLEPDASISVIKLSTWSALISHDQSGYSLCATDSLSGQRFDFKLNLDGSLAEASPESETQIDQCLLKLEQAKTDYLNYQNRIVPIEQMLNGADHLDLNFNNCHFSIHKSPQAYVLQIGSLNHQSEPERYLLSHTGAVLSSTMPGEVDFLITHMLAIYAIQRLELLRKMA